MVTITKITPVSQYHFDGDVLDSQGVNNGVITYHPNLKMLYKFENNINDSSSNANNLLLSAGNVNYVAGQEGNAFSFDGATTLSASDSILPSGNQSWTVAFWLKPIVANPYLISWGSAGAGNDVEFNITANKKLNVGTYGNGSVLVSNQTIPTGSWTHIVISFDGTTIRASINGVQDSIASHTYAIVLNKLWIGSFYNIGGFTQFQIDELRFYNIKLTTTQIAALYMVGKWNQSHTFDNGEYITGSTFAPTNLTQGDWSLSFWHKTPDNTFSTENNDSRVFTDNSNRFFIRIRPTSEAPNNIELFLNKSDQTLFDRIFGSYTPNIYHFESYVYTNSTQNLTYYHDGIFVSSRNLGFSLAPVQNPINIGGKAGSVPYTGQLDDFTFWGKALTQSDVTYLMNNTNPENEPIVININNNEGVSYTQTITTNITSRTNKPILQFKWNMQKTGYVGSIYVLPDNYFASKGQASLILNSQELITDNQLTNTIGITPISVTQSNIRVNETLDLRLWNNTDDDFITFTIFVSFNKQLPAPSGFDNSQTLLLSQPITVLTSKLYSPQTITQLLDMKGFKKLLIAISAASYTKPISITQVAGNSTTTSLNNAIDGSLSTAALLIPTQGIGSNNTWTFKIDFGSISIRQLGESHGDQLSVSNMLVSSDDVTYIAASGQQQFRYAKLDYSATSFSGILSQHVYEIYDALLFGGTLALSFEIKEPSSNTWINYIDSSQIGTISNGSAVAVIIGDVISQNVQVSSQFKTGFILPSTQQNFRIKIIISGASMNLGVTVTRVS